MKVICGNFLGSDKSVNMDSPASTEDSSVTEETRDHWLIDFTGSNSGIDASASDSVNVIQGEDTFSTSSTDSSVRAMQLCRKENIGKSNAKL